MILTLNSKKNGSLLPEVEQVLSSDIQAPLYHTVYGRKHPLAIYNVSCSTVLQNFSKTILELLRVIRERPFLYSGKKNDDTELLADLLAGQKDLLYALMEYLEDCENILACFFPSAEIRNNNIYAKSYRSAIKEYRDHIGKIVNYLKHEQGRLKPLIFFNNGLVLPGYFVVGPIAEDFLGPVEKIHPNGNTAFSFARDLRYNFFHFYAIGNYLSNAIKGITDIHQGNNHPKSDETDKTVLDIASGISGLPLIFYPDEVLKQIPSVAIEEDRLTGTTITLAYPDDVAKVNVISKGAGMRVVVGYQGDGVTRSFRLPYKDDENTKGM